MVGGCSRAKHDDVFPRPRGIHIGHRGIRQGSSNRDLTDRIELCFLCAPARIYREIVQTHTRVTRSSSGLFEEHQLSVCIFHNSLARGCKRDPCGRGPFLRGATKGGSDGVPLFSRGINRERERDP